LRHFKTTSVILGVVDSARSRIETIDEVRDRIDAALEFIDKERLIVAPDCGLGFLTREVALEKLRVLSKAAQSI
jgi:5-methyltetrahydropteroyltriglutamate--homocysteine methyltransferase